MNHDCSADDLCRYDSNLCLIRSSWLIQDNFRDLSADDWQRTQQRQDLRVLYRSRIARVRKSILCQERQLNNLIAI